MKKYLLSIFLLLTSSISYAQQNWQVIGTTDSAIAYLDFNTIKKIDKNLRVWTLYDFRQESLNGYFRINSYTDYSEFDCSQDRLRVLQQTMYSGKMASGTTKNIDTNTDKWLYVVPNTMNEEILKIVCKSKR